MLHLYKTSCSISDVSWVTQYPVQNELLNSVCCSVLQCVAVYSMSHMNAVTRYKTRCSFSDVSWVTQYPVQNESLNFWRQLSVAGCCRVLQCAAVCCSMLQCVAPLQNESFNFWRRWSVAECCSVLQCVAVCCSVLHLYKTSRSISDVDGVLQGVAECCSVLQCVAVCCTFTKWGAQFLTSVESRLSTGWRKYRRCLKLHVSFRKRASNYRVLS